MFTKLFVVDAAERAIKTFAQTLVALLSADGMLGILDVNWGDMASVAGLASVVSILTSIASSSSGNSASLVVDAKKKN